MSVPRLARTVALTPRSANQSRKSADPERRRAPPGVPAGRVERDEVDVGGQRQGQLGQFGGVPGRVVHPVDQRPLERKAPSFGGQVLRARPHEHGQGVAAVERHDLVPQLVAGGVKGDGQVDREAFLGQAADAGDDADGGHGDVAGGMPRSEWMSSTADQTRS